MPYALNWTPGERTAEVHHTALQLDLMDTYSLNPDELYKDRRVFVNFIGGHNRVALVRLPEPGADGVQYALFEMLGMTGFFSWLVNGRYAPVRIWCDPVTRTVVGDTANGHMLVGQRRWVIGATDRTKTVRTDAYERAVAFLNRVGMYVMGRNRQEEVWRAYFQNILEALPLGSVAASSITASAPQMIAGNPWDPRNPYPGCG